MFLHLGGKFSVSLDKLISIHEYLSFSEGKNQNVLKEKEQNIRKIANEGIKSVVFTDNGIFLSPISPETLKERAERMIKEGRKIVSDLCTREEEIHDEAKISANHQEEEE